MIKNKLFKAFLNALYFIFAQIHYNVTTRLLVHAK